MKKIIKDYFSFNSRERVAILFLCCLMAFFWVIPDWYPDKKNEASRTAKEWTESKTDTSQVRIELPSNKLVTSKPLEPVKLFQFDPNELSVEGWKKFGISDKTAQTIQHYLQKGGRFRKPDDLKKIWGMLPQDAERLMPYLRIPGAEKQEIIPRPSPAKKLITPILINQATALELASLPGMSKPLAARMIRFRDKLGGFQNLDQVRRTYGISDSIFSLMAPLIVIKE
jgi:DNA uptake protein ComE-like DNA-binding protein